MEITLYILVVLCTLNSIANTFYVNNIHSGIFKINKKRAFSIPRCGVQDTISSQDVNQYRLKGGNWKSHRLTFAIENYPDGLSKNDVINEITRAFSIWSKYTNLIFELRNSPKEANFKIKFVYGSHGDGIPFDGPGNVLGHSFSPNTGNDSGQIHFDASEQWTIKSYQGINLYQNAAHEIGHALGLDHSSVYNALMSVYYRGYNQSFETELSQDDIEAIQALYGKKEETKNVKSKKSVMNYTKYLKRKKFRLLNNGKTSEN